jgi:hypothetical protein
LIGIQGNLHRFLAGVPACIQQTAKIFNTLFFLKVTHKATELPGHSGILVFKAGNALFHPVLGTPNALKQDENGPLFDRHSYQCATQQKEGEPGWAIKR